MSDKEIVLLRGQRHVVEECGVCGVTFTVPERVYNYRRRKGGFNFCPNGHQWGWSEGTEKRDELRAERDRLKQAVAQRDDEVRHEREMREHAERRTAAAKGQITKLKKRASAGVCPCCNRTFQNLARHMKTKHPEYEDSVIDLDDAREKRA